MDNYKKLWGILIIVLVTTFILLGFMGKEVYNKAPPIPDKFLSKSGDIIISKDDIFKGQSVWQSIGGMELGSILGHGAYQAPDWTADWLHRELTNWLDLKSQEKYSKSYENLAEEQQIILKNQLTKEYKNNNKLNNNTIELSDTRIKAIELTSKYYFNLFGNNPNFKKIREAYAMKENTIPNDEYRKSISNFFFWTSWIASATRPNTNATYTNNWPHEPLVNNKPTTENLIWSITSIILLLAGIGALVWMHAVTKKEEEITPTKTDPLLKVKLTPSQKALWKYLLLVVVLFVAQVFIGGFTAHYTIEGQKFYGVDISQYFPYSLVRTWHIQTALFWIATAFLAAGLFLAPIINGGKDPKFQRFGVNFLFVALFIVVVGSFGGNYLAIAQIMPLKFNFWFGHQGYEFIDLGRFWQILLYIGILFWLLLMIRATISALKNETDKSLLGIFFASFVALGLFYGSGLFYGEHTVVSVMEYWRWWVVHLWVEGFFEVFATAAIAFIFFNLGLTSRKVATATTLASASLFMLGGVPGTFHHLYFSGTTTPILAIGACFSALEVVPLIILGYDGWDHWKLQYKTEWTRKLKWPILCFVAVAFWNMLGAGVFGFMINPPISLYYIQGLNTTAVHAHAALFGVYGFLALGFTLLVLRYIRPSFEFNNKIMNIGFWSLNLGLIIMIAISLLPIGVMQAYASISQGLWYARGADFMQQNSIIYLKWLRTIGDVIFIFGALAFFQQVLFGCIHKANKNS